MRRRVRAGHEHRVGKISHGLGEGAPDRPRGDIQGEGPAPVVADGRLLRTSILTEPGWLDCVADGSVG